MAHPWINPGHRLNKGLTAWHFPAPWLSGVGFPDLIGSNHAIPASGVTGPTWIASPVGTKMAATFLSTGYTVCPSLVQSTDAFTVSCIFSEQQSLTTTRGIICNGTASAGSLTSGWALVLANPNIRFVTFEAGSTRNIISVASIATNNWYHLVGTFDRNRNVKKFYINGKIDTSTTTSGTVQYSGGSLNFGAFTGAVPTGSRRPTITDTRQYNRCLSDQEVLELYYESFSRNKNTFCPPWEWSNVVGKKANAATAVYFRRTLYGKSGSRGIIH